MPTPSLRLRAAPERALAVAAARMRDTPLSYGEAGLVDDPGTAARGYTVERHEGPVGSGAEDFERLAARLLSWDVHLRAGVRVAPRTTAEPGATVAISAEVLGPLAFVAGCRVIAVESPQDDGAGGERRCGFTYGTLAGHPEQGEERFTAVLGPDGVVRFRIEVAWRSGSWVTALVHPLAVAMQRAATQRYLAAARAASRPEG